jgi:hypothetical protein
MIAGATVPRMTTWEPGKGLRVTLLDDSAGQSIDLVRNAESGRADAVIALTIEEADHVWRDLCEAVERAVRQREARSVA